MEECVSTESETEEQVVDEIEVSTSLYKIIKDGRAKFSISDTLTLKWDDLFLNFKIIPPGTPNASYSKVKNGLKTIDIFIPADLVPLCPNYWSLFGFEYFASDDDSDYYFDIIIGKIFENHNFLNIQYSIIQSTKGSDIYRLDRKKSDEVNGNNEHSQKHQFSEIWDGTIFKTEEPHYLSKKDFKNNSELFVLYIDLKRKRNWSDHMIKKHLGHPDYLIDQRGTIKNIDRVDDSPLILKAYWLERIMAIESTPEWISDKVKLEKDREQRHSCPNISKTAKYNCILCEKPNAMRPLDSGWKCKYCGFETKIIE